MKNVILIGCMLLVGGLAKLNAQSSAKIVSSADAFLATLDPAQKAKVLFEFNDEKQRVRWSNLPASISLRAGLKLGDLSESQRKAALGLLAVSLSKQGYEKTLAIMEGDEVLKSGSGESGNMFGRDLYFISILGKPSSKDPWMLQFGGHHLALNLTFAGKDGILTPSHTAAQPAKYTFNGKTIRPLGRETDKANALVNSLDETQRKQAILNYKVADLVLGPGKDGKTIQPEGIKATALTATQEVQLLDVIREWVGIVNDEAAAQRMAEIQSGMSETWFAWSGPITPGSAAYFRIQGPQLVIEYAPQALGGDLTMHIHTIYRDPRNDYGRTSTSR